MTRKSGKSTEENDSGKAAEKAMRFPWQKSNISAFSVISNGCFDRDYTRFCANHVTGHSCVKWYESQNMYKKIFANHGGAKITRASGQSTDCPTSDVAVGGSCSEHTSFLLTERFVAYVLPCLLLLAIFVNIAMVLVTKHLRHKGLHACSYISIIGVINLFLLTMDTTDLWVANVFNVQLVNTLTLYSKELCRIGHLFVGTLLYMRSFLHVALSAALWHMTRDPVLFVQGYTKEWIRNSVIVMITVALFINCQYLWTFTVFDASAFSTQNHGFQCYFHAKWVDPSYENFVWPVLDMLLVSILPYMAVFVLLVRLCIHLYRPANSAGLSYERLSRHVIHVTCFVQLRRALLVFLIAYVVLSSPGVLYVAAKYSYHATHSYSEMRVAAVANEVQTSNRREDMLRERRLQWRDAFQTFEACATTARLILLSTHCVVFFVAVRYVRLQFREYLCCMPLRAMMRKHAATYATQLDKDKTNA